MALNWKYIVNGLQCLANYAAKLQYSNYRTDWRVYVFIFEIIFLPLKKFRESNRKNLHIR